MVRLVLHANAIEPIERKSPRNAYLNLTVEATPPKVRPLMQSPASLPNDLRAVRLTRMIFSDHSRMLLRNDGGRFSSRSACNSIAEVVGGVESVDTTQSLSKKKTFHEFLISQFIS